MRYAVNCPPLHPLLVAVVVLLRCVQAFVIFAFRFHATVFGGTAAGGLLLGGVVKVALFSVKPVLACVDPQAWVKAFLCMLFNMDGKGRVAPFFSQKHLSGSRAGPSQDWL